MLLYIQINEWVLILFFGQISSMIEIEVEMETDVLAAETTSDVVNHLIYISCVMKSCYKSLIT